MAKKHDLKCGTLNVRGLNDKNKRDKVFRWIRNNELDIAFLQESYCTEKFIPYFNAGWKGAALHGHSDSNHSRGVCILLSVTHIVVKMVDES